MVGFQTLFKTATVVVIVMSLVWAAMSVAAAGWWLHSNSARTALVAGILTHIGVLIALLWYLSRAKRLRVWMLAMLLALLPPVILFGVFGSPI